MDPLDDFTRLDFWHDGQTRRVYRKGSGPPVIVIHEMPGITPEVARFGRRVADRGFAVFMPSLFGTDGKKARRVDYLVSLAQVCISRQFALLSEDRPGPVRRLLRALPVPPCRDRGRGWLGRMSLPAISLCHVDGFRGHAPVLANPRSALAPAPARAGRKRGHAVQHLRRRSAVRDRHAGMVRSSDCASKAKNFSGSVRDTERERSAFEG